jgi:predicted nucleic acid-binding protein
VIVYLDTSSLVKLYVEEIDSEKIKKFSHEAAVVSTSKIAYAEARAAFARKRKEAEFSFKVLRKIVEDFNRDWESYFVIEITDGLIRSAGDVAEKYLLRGFDSIHLASAIHLKNKISSDVHFSSYDTRLNQSAEKEGMIILS